MSLSLRMCVCFYRVLVLFYRFDVLCLVLVFFICHSSVFNDSTILQCLYVAIVRNKYDDYYYEKKIIEPMYNRYFVKLVYFI